MEKRRFSRIFFDVSAKLTVADIEYGVDRVANLSVGGCLLEMQDDVPPDGEACIFTILLPRMAPGVDIGGKIVRVRGKELSLQFTSINPENLFHLQNIVRYNAEDPDRIEDEIQNSRGLK